MQMTAHHRAAPGDSTGGRHWLLNAAEVACACLLIFMFFEGPLARMFSDGQESDGNAFLRLIWLPAYALVFALCFTQIPKMFIAGIRMPLLVGLLLVTAASVTWTIDQGLTFRRVIAIGMTSLFGVYFASRYSWKELLRIVAAVTFVLGLMSVFVSLTMPEFGRDFVTHGGAWRGMWGEKNTMGAHMARGTFIFGFLAIVDGRYRRFWIVGLVLCLALVLLSTSKTSLLGTVLGFGVLGIAAWMKRGPLQTISLTWIGVTMGGAIILVLVLDPAAFLNLLGRDATLTGRTDIWEQLTYAIRQNFWLGYGYGSFWSEGSYAAYIVREVLQWPAPTAHNGWLEIWLGVGLIGLVMFLVNFLFTVWRAVKRAFVGWSGVFAVGYLAQFLLFSISESIILQQNAITWVMYMSVATRLVLDVQAAKTADWQTARETYLNQMVKRARRAAASKTGNTAAPESRA